MSDNSWRALIAALADDRAREVYARIVLDESVDATLAALSAGKRRRVLDALGSAGLISPIDGGWRAEPDVFRVALAAAPSAARPTGVERFFTEGRLTVFPSRAADREAVLSHIADRLIARDETVTEAEVTNDLAAIVDDPVTMRRRLVDAGLLVRSRDGSAYRLAP
jgi:hypothetical protein